MLVIAVHNIRASYPRGHESSVYELFYHNHYLKGLNRLFQW